MRDDWDSKKIKEVCVSEQNIKWENEYDEFHYIDLSSVSRETLRITETTLINKKTAPSRAKKIVLEDDVIFSTTRPTLKRVTIIPEEYSNQICSTGYKVLRPKQEVIIPQWIYYYMQTDRFMNRMETLQKGASYPAVNYGDVNNSPIPLPPLDEQKRIVAILDGAFEAIDRAKANIERNIENAEELFESKISEIFSQSSTDWEEKRLKEISNIMYGHTAKSSEDFDGPKYLRITDIQENSVKWDSVPHCLPLKDDLEKYQLMYGDIVFARTGATTGKSFLVQDPPESVFASYLIRVQADLDLLKPDFLYLYFQSPRYWDVINAGISGSAQGGFNATKLGKLNIPIPTVKEQEQLVSKIDAIYDFYSGLLSGYINKLCKLGKLKKSILQQAFSGELTKQQELVA